MSATVTLSNLSWSAADGTSLFHDLTLSFGAGRTGIVGRNGTGKSTLLRLIAGELAPLAGRIHCLGKVALMAQHFAAADGECVADLLGVGPALALLDRAEAGLADAEELAEADWMLPERIDAAMQRMGLDLPARTPLARLSGGQRSRVALAALLLTGPDILLLDEPTNNLDRSGRLAVSGLLRSWQGAAIVVSHDRELLEEMDAIVEVTSLGVSRYGGNYTAYRQAKAAELAAAAHDLGQAEKARHDAARRAQQAAERKARKDSAGQKSRAKGDMPKILMDAARGRAEASGGAGARLRQARNAVAEEELQAARDRIEILQPLQMELAPTGLLPGRPVLEVEDLVLGMPGQPPLIRNLTFSMTGPERLVIAGANGSGKSTLLRAIAGRLAGQAPDLPAEGMARLGGSAGVRVPFAMLDQHLDLLEPGATLLANLRRLNSGMDVQMAHAALARFGFRAADALLLAGSLSGGELLRAGLACTLGAMPPPMLLILDEPTNHLDLDGMEALETALRAYDGAILAVSHDPAFLAALNPDRCIRLGEDDQEE